MEQENVFINRELSWLDFDRRVLALAKDKNVPLAEQLKFAAIYASNMDEFFMVRVGSLQDQMLSKHKQAEDLTDMTPAQQLEALLPRVRSLQSVCDKDYAKLLEALEANGYRKINFEKLNKETERFWKKYFERELFPVLSPQIIDPRNPFPFLHNKETYYCAQLKTKENGISYGLIPIGSQYERMLYVKEGNTICFGLVEELIYHFGALIFDKNTVQKRCLFRVTRNADIELDEQAAGREIDFLQVMSDLLKKRRKLAAVRLQVWPENNPEIQKYLCEKLRLGPERCFVQQSPVDMGCMMRLAGRVASDGHTQLCYPPAKPMQPPASFDLAEEAKKHDVLLAYPYQSIRPFIRMLNKAADDPDVVSIKITLYRMAQDSQIVQALMQAAENGKEVLAMVELRARFDEQNNIDWSKQLEEAGCTVIYGFNEYKVHSKLTLITSKRDGAYHYLTQIGTGNYNEKTSEQYADLAFVTTNPAIGEEAAHIFNNLAIQRLPDAVHTMLVAPLCFKNVLMGEMDKEIEEARAGRPASIILKNNSVNDREILDRLVEASCAGVQVDMIVRGICCIRAGVPGKTENIRIRSLVGRYLEHSRIYCFGEGERMRIYIASGDFLTRNTERRVEVGVRVDDKAVAQKLWGILQLQLNDTVNARVMRPDGSYVRAKTPEGIAPVDSQMAMYGYFNDFYNLSASMDMQSEQPAAEPVRVQAAAPKPQEAPAENAPVKPAARSTPRIDRKPPYDTRRQPAAKKSAVRPARKKSFLEKLFKW